MHLDSNLIRVTRRFLALTSPYFLVCAPVLGAQMADSHPSRLVWDGRAAEHLWNRAGFGATPQQIAADAARPAAEVVEFLMTARQPWKRVDPTLIRWEDFDLDPRGIPIQGKSKYADAPKGEAGKTMNRLRQIDRRQFMEYTDAWFESMIAGDDPVRDHMTLFWHGFFTTANQVVRRKYEVIQQHQFLRDNALGSFRDLLHGIVRDPAMLQYLDNNTNVKGHANENLARELMELFSLGEGHYTEIDVREASRALTGAWADPEGRFQFQSENHDDGEKSILGKQGKFTGTELVDIILQQPACPRWVASKILTYFEGIPPTEARLDDYARFLREQDYQLAPFMRRLFLDPSFYRDEIVGARVQGPIEYVIGMCRKLAVEPPPSLVYFVAAELGQCFYDPPTVKGWDGGETWITNSSLLGRGNCAGILTGAFGPAAPRGDASDTDGTPMEMGERADLSAIVKVEAVAMLRDLAKAEKWQPELELVAALQESGAESDAQVVDWALASWLAIQPSARLRALMLQQLERERAAAGLTEGPLSAGGERAERILRRMAHLIFSLPEAQLG